MRRLATAAALSTLALCLAGCEVNVDNGTQASLSNAADSVEAVAGNAADTVEAVAGNAADAAGTLAEKGAAKVENAADAIGNGHVGVEVHSDGDRNEAAEGNRH